GSRSSFRSRTGTPATKSSRSSRRSFPTTPRRGSFSRAARGCGWRRRSRSAGGRPRRPSRAAANVRGALLERIRTAVHWGLHHGGVPFGVVDVGSNTVRLLVAEHGNTLLSEREMLRLGADIERHGRIPLEKLELTASVVARMVRDASAAGAAAIEIL